MPTPTFTKAATQTVRAAADKISMNTHSSIKLTGVGPDADKIVYVDPYEISGAPHDADAVLITHGHYDHFSPPDIKKILKSDTRLAVPQNLYEKATALVPPERIVPMKLGKAVKIAGISVKATPAYNRFKPFHPKRAGNIGYLLTINGARVYIAGDTDAVPEILKIRCDIALVPVGGTYTMSAREAASLINTIKPALAIPTHYGSLAGKAEGGTCFKNLVGPDTAVRLLI